MYLTRTPALVKPLMKELTWNVPGADRAVYLSFDDGPIPEVTPWVLDELGRYGAKATFFCIGRNARSHPEILARMRAEGHSVGNHTWDHENGWRTSTIGYLRSVLRCQAFTGSGLFRPPYGRITRAQARALGTRFNIVMWEVLSADFDTAIDGERCLRNVLDNTRPGSIVVFHDSLKSEPRLRHALPRSLAYFVKEGYALRALTPALIRA